MIRKLFIATAFVAVTCLAAAPVSAQFGDGSSPNYLFSQYATPNGPNMTTSGMYPAPHYSPQLGAQSYYTYQPLMPHEMMYQHSRNYYNYYNTNSYNNCGAPDSLTKTSVRWQSGPHHIAPLHHKRCGLGYRIHSRKYGLNNCPDGDCNDDCGSTGCGRGHGHLGHRRHGCHGGDCSTGEVYDAAYGEGCASGCSAKLSDGLLQR